MENQIKNINTPTNNANENVQMSCQVELEKIRMEFKEKMRKLSRKQV